MLYAVTFLLGGYVGFGLAVIFCKSSFDRSLSDKADTGVRLESKGKFHTIHSVELE